MQNANQGVRFDRSVISYALEQRLESTPTAPVRVIFELNPEYPRGLDGAQSSVRQLLTQVAQADPSLDALEYSSLSGEVARPYIVATVLPSAVRRAVSIDSENAAGGWSRRAILRVWPDFEVQPMLDRSVATVKGDAARASFAAHGESIVWAVIDSGVDRLHPHFEQWRNLELAAPLEHHDFTDERRTDGAGSATVDDFGIGHGTAVAGIIAGEVEGHRSPLRVRRTLVDGDRTIDPQNSYVTQIGGVAPRCSIVSYKVFRPGQPANVSAVMAALERVQQVNDYGRNIRIHGVNLSLGYSFDPEWFVGGYSPLCTEVDRLVQSGVVVVAAAGNSGFAKHSVRPGIPDEFSVLVTINDPGNAEHAITVGSAHRDAPHRYGISYFSSKGPTGDGRLKPDLVAPGERIISCVSTKASGEGEEDWDSPHYTEFSGTSMATAHVSGAIAAFLSVRREFIGRPQRVKEIFLSAATDLGRVREFQGHGLVDVMRALQAV